MATASKAKPKPKPVEEEIDWNEILNELKTTGQWYRPKDGRTRVRLVLPEDTNPREFFKEVQSSYNGNIKTRYMVLGLILDGTGATEEMSTTVTPIVIAKTVLKGIVSLLAEGYELFGEDGHGVTINRSGQGLNTDYSILPSRKPVDLPDDITWPTETFEEMAEQFSTQSFERDKNRSEGKQKSGKPVTVLDEDEDEEDF